MLAKLTILSTFGDSYYDSVESLIGVSSSSEYGKWEQLLVSLEIECNLNEWVYTFNAAYELLNILQDFNLDAWYSWPNNEDIKFYMPILPPGFYPKNKKH